MKRMGGYGITGSYETGDGVSLGGWAGGQAVFEADSCIAEQPLPILRIATSSSSAAAIAALAAAPAAGGQEVTICGLLLPSPLNAPQTTAEASARARAAWKRASAAALHLGRAGAQSRGVHLSEHDQLKSSGPGPDHWAVISPEIEASSAAAMGGTEEGDAMEAPGAATAAELSESQRAGVVRPRAASGAAINRPRETADAAAATGGGMRGSPRTPAAAAAGGGIVYSPWIPAGTAAVAGKGAGSPRLVAAPGGGKSFTLRATAGSAPEVAVAGGGTGSPRSLTVAAGGRSGTLRAIAGAGPAGAGPAGGTGSPRSPSTAAAGAGAGVGSPRSLAAAGAGAGGKWDNLRATAGAAPQGLVAGGGTGSPRSVAAAAAAGGRPSTLRKGAQAGAGVTGAGTGSPRSVAAAAAGTGGDLSALRAMAEPAVRVAATGSPRSSAARAAAVAGGTVDSVAPAGLGSRPAHGTARGAPAAGETGSPRSVAAAAAGRTPIPSLQAPPGASAYASRAVGAAITRPRETAGAVAVAWKKAGSAAVSSSEASLLAPPEPNVVTGSEAGSPRCAAPPTPPAAAAAATTSSSAGGLKPGLSGQADGSSFAPESEQEYRSSLGVTAPTATSGYALVAPEGGEERGWPGAAVDGVDPASGSAPAAAGTTTQGQERGREGSAYAAADAALDPSDAPGPVPDTIPAAAPAAGEREEGGGPSAATNGVVHQPTAASSGTGPISGAPARRHPQLINAPLRAAAAMMDMDMIDLDVQQEHTTGFSGFKFSDGGGNAGWKHSSTDWFPPGALAQLLDQQPQVLQEQGQEKQVADLQQLELNEQQEQEWQQLQEQQQQWLEQPYWQKQWQNQPEQVQQQQHLGQEQQEQVQVQQQWHEPQEHVQQQRQWHGQVQPHEHQLHEQERWQQQHQQSLPLQAGQREAEGSLGRISVGRRNRNNMWLPGQGTGIFESSANR